MKKSTPRPRQEVPGGERLFQRMFTRLGCQGRPPHFVVEYYPYAGLTHTIRLRDDAAIVRLSDLLRGAPLPVFEAAAALLLGRLFRREPPVGLVRAYRQFRHAGTTRHRVHRVRRARARRRLAAPRGNAHDLGRLFDQLNRRYFSGRLRRPNLGWSTRAWRRQLGCFDPGLDQIGLNPKLDRPRVPSYVVEYVLFHEMLHVKHPVRAASCGLQAHSAGFRREEKRFAEYEKARRFLERLL